MPKISRSSVHARGAFALTFHRFPQVAQTIFEPSLERTEIGDLGGALDLRLDRLKATDLALATP